MVRFAAAALMAAGIAGAAPPAFAERQPVTLSETVGHEIDPAERAAYGLLPDVEGFVSARIFRTSESEYRLEYVYRDGGKERVVARRLRADAFELARWHAGFVEAYAAASGAAPADTAEAETLRRLALRYASRRQYDAAAALAGDLERTYPETPGGRWAREFGPWMKGIERSRRGLIQPGGLLDQSGRTEVLIFSGYFGAWVGIATPIAVDAISAGSVAAGLLLGAPASILLANELTRNAEIPSGRATMISLGGHLGTWQGIGWAAEADVMEGREITACGELAGLAGIVGAVVLTHNMDFSEGHAGITSSGLQWGAWLGAVAGVLLYEQDEPILPAMLIGSDALVLVGAVAARDVRMSKTRVRLINLSGVVGTLFGLGVAVLTEVDEGDAVMAMTGAGSVAGLLAGASLTRNFDRGKDLAWCAPLAGLETELGLRAGLADERPVPYAGVRVRF
jgi:hypothetical protein